MNDYIKLPVISSTSIYSGVRVKKTSTQALVNDTQTVVTWNAEDFDTGNYHNNVTNNSRLTVSQTGYYSLKSCLQWGVDTSGPRVLLYRINGGTALALSSTTGISNRDTRINGTIDLYLNSGDYIEIVGLHAAVGSLSLQIEESFAGLTFLGI